MRAKRRSAVKLSQEYRSATEARNPWIPIRISPQIHSAPAIPWRNLNSLFFGDYILDAPFASRYRSRMADNIEAQIERTARKIASQFHAREASFQREKLELEKQAAELDAKIDLAKRALQRASNFQVKIGR